MPERHAGAADEGEGADAGGGEGAAMPPDPKRGDVAGGGWMSADGLIIEEPLEVGGELGGGGIAAAGIFLQGAEDDPVESPSEGGGMERWRGPLPARHVAARRLPNGCPGLLTEPPGGPGGSDFADEAAHFVQPLPGECFDIKGGLAGEQLIEQCAESIDVAAGVCIRDIRELLRRHVKRGANEDAGPRGLSEAGIALGVHGLGDAEVDDLRHGPPVHLGDEDVGRLQVAMDDAFLMGVVDAEADFFEERDALAQRCLVPGAVTGDGHALDELHHKVGPPVWRHARLQHGGDAGIPHGGQGLTLLLEACQHSPAVHAELDHFQRHLATDGVALLRPPDDAETALAQLFHQAVVTDDVAHFQGVSHFWQQHALQQARSCGIGQKFGSRHGCNHERA